MRFSNLMTLQLHYCLKLLKRCNFENDGEKFDDESDEMMKMIKMMEKCFLWDYCLNSSSALFPYDPFCRSGFAGKFSSDTNDVSDGSDRVIFQ